MLQGSYSPHEAWKEALDAREQALARRQYIGHERWQEHTKNLPALKEGDSVYVQNVVGNHPRRWERTGTVVECKEYDQYNIKIDGSNRCTLRNRKHLRKFSPPQKHIQQFPRIPVQFVEEPISEPEMSVPTALEVPRPDEHPKENQVDAAPQKETTQQPILPAEPPMTPPHARPDANDNGVPTTSNRPQRERKPNRWLDADTWDLSGVDVKDTILHSLLEPVRDLLELLAKQVANQHQGGKR